MKKRNVLLMAALAGGMIAANAQAVVVDIELSLIVDVSGSIDASEYHLQLQGYHDAFASPTFFSSIVGAGHTFAVNFIQWSGAAQQQQSIAWTQITNQAQATAFGNAILALEPSRPFANNTAPGSAINFAAPLFNGNGFEGGRKVIDCSGDGAQNEGADTATARDAALAGGINQINGLAILGEANLHTFYQNNIVGGAGSFLIDVTGFNTFAEGIDRKLRIEIGAPLPAAAGTGLATMGLVTFMRRRRQTA